MPTVIRCPSCDRSLRVPENLLGTRVRCPGCQTAFTAEAAGEAPPPAAAPAPPPGPVTDRPSRRPQPSPQPAPRADDEEDFQDPYEGEPDEDEPPRRRRGGRSRELARAMVSGPAIALMVTGILGIVLGAFILVMALLGGGMQLARPNLAAAEVRGPAHADTALVTGLNVVEAGIIMLCGTLVTYGANQMRSLKSRAWAMTASILAMIPCSGCCILGLPFGIWSLVVLNKPEVTRAFG